MRSTKDESSHLLRQPGARVPAGVFFTGSHNGGFSSAGRWSVVWMKMVLLSLSKANEGFLCSEGCYVQRAAGLLCNVRALAFRLILRSEPSRLRPLLDGM